MNQRLNAHGQPIGLSLAGWTPPPVPSREPFEGRTCSLLPVDVARDADALHAAFAPAGDAMWTYLPYGPFADAAAYRAWLAESARGSDPLFFTIVRRADAKPVGLAAYLRIVPEHGVVEVGHLQYSPLLQRSREATEAMYLMMKRAFALGYRRYEWKCDTLNAPSRAAAERLGFRYEGLFRNAITYKERTRDTTWFSVIDSEWPTLERAFEAWLADDNFDARGNQKKKLTELRG